MIKNNILLSIVMLLLFTQGCFLFPGEKEQATKEKHFKSGHHTIKIKATRYRDQPNMYQNYELRYIVKVEAFIGAKDLELNWIVSARRGFDPKECLDSIKIECSKDNKYLAISYPEIEFLNLYRIKKDGSIIRSSKEDHYKLGVKFENLEDEEITVPEINQ